MTESDRAAFGTNFMHHLGGLADDVETSTAVREAAWRLAARGVPKGGFLHPLPSPLEPGTDAAAIIVECRNRYACIEPPAGADE